MISPLHTPGSALKRLTDKCKALGNLCLRTVGATTLFSTGDDDVDEDVELEHDLDLVQAPARPISPIEVLLVYMVCKIEDLISTVIYELVNELVNIDAGDADAKALASQRLTKKDDWLSLCHHCAGREPAWRELRIQYLGLKEWRGRRRGRHQVHALGAVWTCSALTPVVAEWLRRHSRMRDGRVYHYL